MSRHKDLFLAHNRFQLGIPMLFVESENLIALAGLNQHQTSINLSHPGILRWYFINDIFTSNLLILIRLDSQTTIHSPSWNYFH